MENGNFQMENDRIINGTKTTGGKRSVWKIKKAQYEYDEQWLAHSPIKMYSSMSCRFLLEGKTTTFFEGHIWFACAL